MQSFWISGSGRRLTRLHKLEYDSSQNMAMTHHLIDTLIRWGFFSFEAFLVTSDSKERRLNSI